MVLSGPAVMNPLLPTDSHTSFPSFPSTLLTSLGTRYARNTSVLKLKFLLLLVSIGLRVGAWTEDIPQRGRSPRKQGVGTGRARNYCFSFF